jgi:hypothetical protein
VNAFVYVAPALQVHAEISMLPASEFEYAKHAVHEVIAVDEPNVPTPQTVHIDAAVVLLYLPSIQTPQNIEPI